MEEMAGGFPPFMATSFAQRTKARLTQAQRPYGPSISVKLEGLGKVPGAEFAGKILQMFGRQFGKFNAHFWGFEYDMM